MELPQDVKTQLVDLLRKTRSGGGEGTNLAPEAPGRLLTEIGDIFYDDMKSLLEDGAEMASMGAVVTAFVGHQARMSTLVQGERYAEPVSTGTLKSEPVTPPAAERIQVYFRVLVFSDDECTQYTGEVLHRRVRVDAIPRAGDSFAPSQLGGFSTLMPVVHHVEHAPFPESSNEPTVTVVVHVAETAESAQAGAERRNQLHEDGWHVTVPRTA